MTGGTLMFSICQRSPPRATRDFDSKPVLSSPSFVKTPATSMLSIQTPVKSELSAVL